ncbi:cinnamycin family lantibiotic [Saccharopolyspora taberi]|uniref:Cinnamycin family lantibiotic n=1 Tax=Saccharopolyspora taberi TaxID=60895 RepID=A0ABN3VHG3_9PSEU
MSPTLLQRAVVDGEFRSALLADPAAFGVAADALPAPVEQPDQESLDFWTEGISAVEIYACESTCSFGPFTVVCDGTTK